LSYYYKNMPDLMMKKPTNCLHSIVLSVKSDEVEHTKLIILRSSRKNCTDSLLQYQWWVTKFYPGHIYWLSKSTKTRFIRGKYQPTIFFIFKNWYQEFWHFNMCIMLEKFFDLLCQIIKCLIIRISSVDMIFETFYYSFFF